MHLDTIDLPKKNKLMESYIHDPEFVHSFFDYEVTAAGYEERAKELATRSFQRRELASVIEQYMQPFGISPLASQHIEELSSDAWVVIGGQQAGIMTGPLYSVHKAITVILIARQQREFFGKAVVPVFWIAGEDHDINEINHTYTAYEGKAMKRQFKQPIILKTMASDTVYDAKEMSTFIRKIFKGYGETSYTQKLMHEVLQSVEQQRTYTGFFTSLINHLFADYGLLLIDAAYQPLRQLESPYFSQMIENSATIAESIYAAEQKLHAHGYAKPIESEEADANLFYVHETGRVLLKRMDGKFVNEQSGISFTETEIHQLAIEQPWLLSNNVATRPLMQDLVFPVLAFVGGPGEIAYWSLLRQAFHTLGIKLPVVAPRLSITLVTRQAQEAMKRTDLSITQVLAHQVPEIQRKWLDDQRDETFIEMIREVKQQLEKQYEEMYKHLYVTDASMLPILEKNLQFHTSQFDYLQKKKEQSTLLKHDVQNSRYNVLNEQLFPDGSLQERLYSPYFFMNQYGDSLIGELLKQPYSFDGSHQVVYL
ncbi:bacillithiol biosynthesis cysteine-adding enzyme BshC [Sporosarcina sp. PTS2304]|uniref:bacillithiol biosynthesis cysteine-adding enzyme BshC n=1 Tax=Sporosarcina sp. PTS2304 TaxID=2283194 RepID=UPI000E0D5595|nr:bacillithiol biosynthesis cysteine-adding enzyme BshC [Sporosarcina sp. PTS2304]AXH98617.1 bacillithiol biosynthesis cysteine-adding enzyme BshC [Sporosarcina sp. PTS2304]